MADVSSAIAPTAGEREPLRSTSMPTEPLVDDVPPSDSPLDTQLLEIFFDRMPMGVAVFGTDLRLRRCNKTWSAFFEHYLGVSADYAVPGRHLAELIPGNEAAVRQMVDSALAGQVIRQAAQRITVPGSDTYWDVVFAPLFDSGHVAGMVDIVTDATDRVRSFQRLEARIAMFSQVAAGMSVEQPLSATLSQVVNAAVDGNDTPPQGRQRHHAEVVASELVGVTGVLRVPHQDPAIVVAAAPSLGPCPVRPRPTAPTGQAGRLTDAVVEFIRCTRPGTSLSATNR